MKNLTLISLLLLTSCVVTQLPTEQTTLEKVINVPGVAQNELYVRANTWFVKTFNSAESVIEFQDKEAGKIAGKYSLNYSLMLSPFRSTQSITVDVKESKARIRIENPSINKTALTSQLITSYKTNKMKRSPISKFFVTHSKHLSFI